MQNNNIINFSSFSIQVVNFSITTIKNVVTIFSEAFIIYSGNVFLVINNVTICSNGKRFWFDDNTNKSLNNFYFSRIKPKEIYNFIYYIFNRDNISKEDIKIRMDAIDDLLDEHFGTSIHDLSSNSSADLSEFEDIAYSLDSSNDSDTTFNSGFSGLNIPRTNDSKPSAIERAREHVSSKKDKSNGLLYRAMKYHDSISSS